jgi:hypothetical protein
MYNDELLSIPKTKPDFDLLIIYIVNCNFKHGTRVGKTKRSKTR